MRFYSPEYFKWELLGVVFFVIAVVMFRRSRLKWQKVFSSKNLKTLTQSYSPKKARWRVALDILVVTLIVLALCRPQAGQSTEKQKSEGLEIIFAIDVSPSMLAEDVRPSRLEYVKLEAARMVDRLQGSKIGIVALGGSASVLCPMTPDGNALKVYIDGLDVNSVSTRGTDFKMAFQEVVKAFKEGGTTSDEMVASGANKVVILFSDGENHEDGAKEAIEAVAKEGIKVFTVTVGTEKGGTIPVRDRFGFLKDEKKDQKGQTVITKSNPALMNELARLGHGASYYFMFGGTEPERLVSDLDKLDKGEFDSQVVTKYDEKFQPILFIAIIFAFVNLLLGNRSLVIPRWRGRYT